MKTPYSMEEQGVSFPNNTIRVANVRRRCRLRMYRPFPQSLVGVMHLRDSGRSPGFDSFTDIRLPLRE